MVFKITNGSTNAIKPTTTPTAPHKRACLAAPTLPGSPLADKNRNPATRNMITANPTNIGHKRFNIPLITPCTVPLGGFGWPPGRFTANIIAGSVNKTDEVNTIANFLFISFGCQILGFQR